MSPIIYGGSSSSGGSTPVYSWLGAYLHTAIVGPAGGAVAVWDHPADALVGTDLSISSDGLTVSYLTTGLYVLSLFVSATSSAPPASLGVLPAFDHPQSDSYWYVADASPFLTVDATNDFQLTWPPAKIVAGDSMTVAFNVSASVTLGTGSTLWVARIA